MLGVDAILWCLLFFSRYGDHRDPHVLTHSFPTRRFSDPSMPCDPRPRSSSASARRSACVMSSTDTDSITCTRQRDSSAELSRSEEHTSGLQSLMRISYAAFCLRKKKDYQATRTKTNWSHG